MLYLKNIFKEHKVQQNLVQDFIEEICKNFSLWFVWSETAQKFQKVIRNHKKASCDTQM